MKFLLPFLELDILYIGERYIWLNSVVKRPRRSTHASKQRLISIIEAETFSFFVFKKRKFDVETLGVGFRFKTADAVF